MLKEYFDSTIEIMLLRTVLSVMCIKSATARKPTETID